MNYFQPKHIDHIRIRAAEADIPITGCRWCTAVAKDVNVRKGNVHRHGAELAPLRIIVKGITYLVTTVTSMTADPVYQGNLDLGFAHDTTP